MGKIFVAEHLEKDTTLFGLFYEDEKGKRKHLTEDFKEILFADEADAYVKLAEIENERAREDEAVPFSLAEAKTFAKSHRWKFASTYAKTAPHEYLVKNWLSEDEKILYRRFVRTMKGNSVVGYFYGHENRYLILGEYYYWFMFTPENMAVDLINRTTTDYLEFRDGAYYYVPGGRRSTGIAAEAD